jgi:hypothetical protein
MKELLTGALVAIWRVVAHPGDLAGIFIGLRMGIRVP